MYQATKCPCGHPVCQAWHVDPVASVQGVRFTEDQARKVANFLNRRTTPPVIRPSIKRLISRNAIRRHAVRPIGHQISFEFLRVFDKSNNGAQTVSELKNRVLRILESKPC